MTTFFGINEGKNAQRFPLRFERNQHYRTKTDFAHNFQMLFVTRKTNEQFVRYIRIKFRLSGAKHIIKSLRFIRVRRIALINFMRPNHLFGVGMSNCQTIKRSVSVSYIDAAPIGEMRNGKASDGRERRFIVERGGERSARLGKKLLILFFLSAFGNVDRDAAHTERGMEGVRAAQPIAAAGRTRRTKGLWSGALADRRLDELVVAHRGDDREPVRLAAGDQEDEFLAAVKGDADMGERAGGEQTLAKLGPAVR